MVIRKFQVCSVIKSLPPKESKSIYNNFSTKEISSLLIEAEIPSKDVIQKAFKIAQETHGNTMRKEKVSTVVTQPSVRFRDSSFPFALCTIARLRWILFQLYQIEALTASQHFESRHELIHSILPE